MGEQVVDDIRHRLDIVDVVGEHVTLTKKGRNYHGLCPFHHEKTPSFTVSREKQIFHCFGCGTGGDVFTFVMQKEGLTFPEALERLAQIAGVELPKARLSPAEERAQQQREKLYRINQAAQDFFCQALRSEEGRFPRAYLEKRAVPPEMVEAFGLGYAPNRWDGLAAHLGGLGYADGDLEKLGLASPKSNGKGLVDRFRNRLMFPIHDIKGRVIGFGGRILEDDPQQAKYLNSPETPLFHKGTTLYAIHRAATPIREADQVIVVEGYMDALMAHCHGIAHVVACLGTALTLEQGKLLTRYTQKAVLSYDADRAGVAAALRGGDILKAQGFQVKVLRIPQGKDPDDYLKRYGRDGFLNLAAKAASLFEFKLDQLLNQHDKDTVEGKVAIVGALAKEIGATANTVEREGYVQILSRRLNLSEQAIWGEVAKITQKIEKKAVAGHKKEISRNTKEYPSNSYSRTVPKNRVLLAKCLLVKLAVEDPAILPFLEDRIGLAALQGPGPLEAIGKLLQELYSSGGDFTASSLVARLGDEERRWLSQLLLDNSLGEGNRERSLEDACKVLERDAVREKMALLMKEIVAYQEIGDTDGVQKRLAAYNQLMHKQKQLGL